MFTTFDKAIAAFLAAIISLLTLSHVALPGFLTDQTTQTAIAAFITGVITYLIPNKPA